MSHNRKDIQSRTWEGQGKSRFHSYRCKTRWWHKYSSFPHTGLLVPGFPSKFHLRAWIYPLHIHRLHLRRYNPQAYNIPSNLTEMCIFGTDNRILHNTWCLYSDSRAQGTDRRLYKEWVHCRRHNIGKNHWESGIHRILSSNHTFVRWNTRDKAGYWYTTSIRFGKPNNISTPGRWFQDKILLYKHRYRFRYEYTHKVYYSKQFALYRRHKFQNLTFYAWQYTHKYY